MERNLVDGKRLVFLAADIARAHAQRVDDRLLGCLEALAKLVGMVVVHEEADRAAVHAIDRHAEVHRRMQRLQHETVTAEGNDDVGLLGGHVTVALT